MGKYYHRSIPNDEDSTQRALKATYDQLQYRLDKLRANSGHLNREMLLLQRHIKELNHPFYENWEANTLTRLIDVVHAHQVRKLPRGVAMGLENEKDQQNQTLAYCNAAKRVELTTVWRLGLSETHHEALMRYPEVRYDCQVK